jgi:diguanylate cyclase (GGDEF)-like protein
MRANIGRFNDVIARFGGEEFVALLPFTNEEAAGKLADTVRVATENMEIPLIEKTQDEPFIKITVSGGVACIVPDFDTVPEELISAADKALYRAKQTGRNRICPAGNFVNSGGDDAEPKDAEPKDDETEGAGQEKADAAVPAATG